MLVGNGSNLPYRAIARFTNITQRENMMKHLRAAGGRVCAFDNTTEAGILIADFERQEERNAFGIRFGSASEVVQDIAA